jgi:hypothetical protein
MAIANSAVFNNDGIMVNYCTSGSIGGVIQNEGTIANNYQILPLMI